MNNVPLGLSLPIQKGNNGYFDMNYTTIDQIKTNIINILNTKQGERRFNNSFGTSLYKYLFEQLNTSINGDIVSHIIQNDITTYIPNITINNVTISDVDNYLSGDTINNGIYVSISFIYNNISDSVNTYINI